MGPFVDETNIEVTSGDGGGGAVSFRREKYVPMGGPDGGDGGRGGDVIFVAQPELKSLSRIHRIHRFSGENGESGHYRRKHGRDGQPIRINVPVGTILRDSDNGKIIKDFVEAGEWVFLRGGKGGKGNQHFATPRRQAPRYAQPGLPGATSMLRVELNIIADIGLVGKPNAGKSTLLSVLTNAHPEVGAYPFTTKSPNLGVVRESYAELVVADIPGLIKGASQGAGLGDKFLKHIARTKALAFLIDLSDSDFERSFDTLVEELRDFDSSLLNKKRIVVGSKIDIDGAIERAEDLRRSLSGEDVFAISSHTHLGLGELKGKLFELVSGG